MIVVVRLVHSRAAAHAPRQLVTHGVERFAWLSTQRFQARYSRDIDAATTTTRYDRAAPLRDRCGMLVNCSRLLSRSALLHSVRPELGDDRIFWENDLTGGYGPDRCLRSLTKTILTRAAAPATHAASTIYGAQGPRGGASWSPPRENPESIVNLYRRPVI